MSRGRLKPPKALLLDFDETLVDNSTVAASISLACDEIVLAIAGLERSALLAANKAAWSAYWPEVERLCWVDQMDVLDVSREVWRRALRACGHHDPSAVDLAFDTHQRIGRDTMLLFDDVTSFLEVLREQRIATALVTNSSTRAQTAKIEAAGLSAAFDVVVISGQVGVAKPEPAIFAAAIDRLQLKAEDVWHVGDSLSTDVAGAAAAGIRSVWLNRAQRELTPSDPVPDVRVTSLSELADLLCRR